MAPWAFSTWGINHMGNINTHSKEGYKLIITMIEYITKWVEVIPMKSIFHIKITQFIIENIITRFGVP